MTDVVTLAAEAVHQAQHAPSGGSPLVRKLFLLMHGAYGNLFVSKFATGEKDGKGKDKGIRAAMMVWDSKLQSYPPEVVETAAGRLQRDHPDFPPNLPQFEKLCEAAMPRKTYAEEAGLPMLPAPAPAAPIKVTLEKQNDGKDWARVLVARSEAGDKIRPYTLQCARQALGMEGRMPWQ